MKSILILLTAFTLSALSADIEGPKIGPDDQQLQRQEHQKPVIKNPELKAKMEEMQTLREKMEKLRKEIKELAEKEGIKLPPRPEGGNQEGGKQHRKQGGQGAGPGPQL